MRFVASKVDIRFGLRQSTGFSFCRWNVPVEDLQPPLKRDTLKNCVRIEGSECQLRHRQACMESRYYNPTAGFELYEPHRLSTTSCSTPACLAQVSLLVRDNIRAQALCSLVPEYEHSIV